MFRVKKGKKEEREGREKNTTPKFICDLKEKITIDNSSNNRERGEEKRFLQLNVRSKKKKEENTRIISSFYTE